MGRTTALTLSDEYNIERTVSQLMPPPRFYDGEDRVMRDYSNSKLNLILRPPTSIFAEGDDMAANMFQKVENAKYKPLVSDFER